MAYWLMKSEPDAYSIDDLERDGREKWDGIRNYQARNMMRDDMKIGDEIFFYHSNCKEPGIVGIMQSRQRAVSGPDTVRQDVKVLRPEEHARGPTLDTWSTSSSCANSKAISR